MTKTPPDSLLERAMAISHDLWRAFRLPDGMEVTAVGPCDFEAIDRGYRSIREITYLSRRGGRPQKGHFVVHDIGMHHSNDRWMIDAGGSAFRQTFDMPRAMHRLNSGMAPFDRDTSLAEVAVHLGYWTKIHYPFDAWHQTDVMAPLNMTRSGSIISAIMPIKFFETAEDVVPTYGTFEISFNEKTFEIIRAQCLRPDGTPYRSISDRDLNEVYSDAGIKNPDPTKSRRLRESLQHACEGRAESVWREFALPPGLDIVRAERDFKVQDSGVDFEFTRKFEYSERGRLKRGTFWVCVGDSSATWKNHWIDSRGVTHPEYYPPKSDAAIRMGGFLGMMQPETVEESVERLVIVAWDHMSFDDGVEAFATDPYAFHEEDGCVIAERRIRYWVPNSDKFGPVYPDVAQIGVFKVAMNADTNAIMSIECISADGHFEIGHLDVANIEDLHEAAGVPVGQNPNRLRT